MKVAVSADHAGYAMKEELVFLLKADGHEVNDLGTYSTDPVDYPDFAKLVGEAVQKGTAERGIIVCGSGVGASMVANKMRGVRAGLCHDAYSAHQGVEHDDMNVLCLGGRVIGIQVAQELVRAFLSAKFAGEERFVRRLAKVARLEEEQG